MKNGAFDIQKGPSSRELPSLSCLYETHTVAEAHHVCPCPVGCGDSRQDGAPYDQERGAV